MANYFADVSSFQPSTLSYFQAARAAGAKAVVVKLTEGSEAGTAYHSPKAAQQVASARQAGLLVHAYHYARFRGAADARAEASWFVKMAKRDGVTTNSVMVCDAEWTGMNSNATADINTFLAAVKAAGYKKVDTYASASWWNGARIIKAKLLSKNNWVASYGSKSSGVSPTGAWQYTSTKRVSGNATDWSIDYSGLYTTGVVKAAKPTVLGKLEVDDSLGPATIRAWQRHEGTPVDGVLSSPSRLVKAVQRKLGTKADGIISKPHSSVVAAMQRKLGTTVDGKISKPYSSLVAEIQRRLNTGTLPF